MSEEKELEQDLGTKLWWDSTVDSNLAFRLRPVWAIVAYFGPQEPPSGPLWEHLGAILRSIWPALLRSAVVEDATARPRGVLGSAKWPKCCRVCLFLMLYQLPKTKWQSLSKI